jgi:hypothetical protein
MLTDATYENRKFEDIKIGGFFFHPFKGKCPASALMGPKRLN